jgi:glycogen debranching enzyme
MTTSTRSSGHGNAAHRKGLVLSETAASQTSSITDAAVIKHADLFLVTRPDGSMPGVDGDGHGLYARDCRYLRRWKLRVAGTRLQPLVTNVAEGNVATIQHTNLAFTDLQGVDVPKEHLGIELRRAIDGDHDELHECITLTSYHASDLDLQVELWVDSCLDDIFSVRGQVEVPGLDDATRRTPHDDGISFERRGSDGDDRSIRIIASPAPDSASKSGHLRFRVPLPARGEARIHLVHRLCSTGAGSVGQRERTTSRDMDAVVQHAREASHAWDAGGAHVETDSPLFDGLLARSMIDLRMLTSQLHDLRFFAAGVPWFTCLFGRDSLITAMQVLPWRLDIAESTLRLLARYQGREYDEWLDEEPGKILHELRHDELTNDGTLPYRPYYGSVDSTLLFLRLVAAHARWSGSLALFEELEPAVLAALEWSERRAQQDVDGFITYDSELDGERTIQKGWKDSGIAIVDAQGRVARPPIALVEVQAYAHSAWCEVADLLEHRGDQVRARGLRERASRLRDAVRAEFWDEELGTFAMAIAGEQRERCLVSSSNAGQVLWSEVPDREQVRRTVERLLHADMFSGWGVRTLSTRARAFNPVSYHLGSVWPHDNSIIAAGMRQHGCDDAAMRICEGILDAARHFDQGRLPELFGGHDRGEFGVPVHYPVACHPQAWAAGSVPSLLTTMLGLRADALNGRLRVVRPRLPSYVDELEMTGLRVGGALIALRFARDGEAIRAEVMRAEGDSLEVEIEQ